MSFRKRLASVGLSAALVGSLLATTAGSVLGAAHDNTAYLSTCVPASCSVVGDGISLIVIDNSAVALGTTVPAGNSLQVQISGATFAAATGNWTLSGGVITATAGTIIGPDQDGAGADLADNLTVRAASAPGSATISFYHVPTAGGNAVSAGTFVVTFYAASALAVSEANSTSTLAATSIKADGTETTTLTLVVKNANGDTLTTGVSVAATITPVGLISNNDGGAYAQTATDAASTYVFNIKGSGLAGVATIAIQVTYNSVTSTFASKTITFTGALASLTLSNNTYSVATSGAGTGAVSFVAKDASGNALAQTFAGLTKTVSTGAPFTAPTGGDSTVTTAGTINTPCGATAGTGTLTVSVGSVTSNAVTIVCAGPAASFTVAFNVTSVAPGGTATFTATVKDSGGRPAPDGTLVTAVTNAGALVGDTSVGIGAGDATSNGAAVFTLVAPNTTGVVTVTAFQALVAGSQSASITVGAAAGTADSALGVTTSGPFSTSTKVQSVGKYVTFRFDFGATAAGKTVTILSATKTGTTWSSFTTLTARVANSSGVVYYYVRQSSATWKSYRAQESSSGAITPARQARWV